MSDSIFVNDHTLLLAEKDKKRREEDKEKARIKLKKYAKDDNDYNLLAEVLGL